MKNILLAGLGLLMLSCFEQGDCSDYSSTTLHLKFYSFTDKKVTGLALDSILMDGFDEVLHKDDSTSSVDLPLNPANETATFHFYYDSQHAILDVNYTVKTFALAPDCEVIDLITIKDATHVVIQDLKISTPDLTVNATENIKLYF